jgi:hypothetical protein
VASENKDCDIKVGTRLDENVDAFPAPDTSHVANDEVVGRKNEFRTRLSPRYRIHISVKLDSVREYLFAVTGDSE